MHEHPDYQPPTIGQIRTIECPRRMNVILHDLAKIAAERYATRARNAEIARTWHEPIPAQ